MEHRNSEQQPSTRRERRRIERQRARKKDLVAQPQKRTLLGFLAFGGALLGIGLWRPWEKEVKVASSVETVNTGLVQGIKDLEADYTREDLLDPEIRQKHLRMSAEFFSRYSGTDFTPEELIASVHFLSAQEFSQRFGEDVVRYSAARTDPKTGQVYINTESGIFQRNYIGSQSIQELKTMLPYWSSLSRARTIYWHEFFHKTATESAGKKPDITIIINQDGKNYQLEAVNGFSLEYQATEGSESIFDSVFDEAMVIFFTSIVEGQFSGYQIFERIPENLSSARENSYMRQIDACINSLMELFGKRRQWFPNFQQYYKDSDFFGMARFLARQSGVYFKDNIEPGKYGFDLIMDMISREGRFRQFLDRLK